MQRAVIVHATLDAEDGSVLDAEALQIPITI
jgi:hypothetical protein